MLHVSLFIELLRSQPRVTFWCATLAQALVWWLVPTFFYSAPPGDLADVLALGHEFQLGAWRGPPLAFWVAEIAFRIAGMTGVYLVAQACVVTAYWAVFAFARAVVGAHHAVIAVALMIGVSAMSLPTPEFGPTVMAIPLFALVILHFWRAIGQGRRAYWFLLAIEIGLLLLTTYAGLIVLALLVVFVVATARGRSVLLTVDPWMAGIVIVVMLLPHLIWLDTGGVVVGEAMLRRWRELAPAADFARWLRVLAAVTVAHAGLAVLVALSAGWWMRKPDTAPNFVRGPVDPFARLLIYVGALAPVLMATASATIAGEQVSVGALAPYLTMSGLAVVVAAGPVIVVHRQRIVGFAWALLLLMPPVIVVTAIAILPWAAGIELKVAAPADAMGRFFAENFERRTGKPLQIVTGESRLSALVAVGAPSRPSLYDLVRPERTPWVGELDILAKGAVVLWNAVDTAGAPPPDIRARFPDLAPELPRAFERAVQGRLPLARIGWGVIRPQAAP